MVEPDVPVTVIEPTRELARNAGSRPARPSHSGTVLRAAGCALLATVIFFAGAGWRSASVGGGPLVATASGDATVGSPRAPLIDVSSTDTGGFEVAGRVVGLVRGESTVLVLMVTNPHGADLTVTSVTSGVGDASMSCPASNLFVGKFSGSLVVPAHRSARLPLGVRLAADAPIGCEGQTFPLQFTALGNQD